MRKKILAVLTALAMVSSLLPMTAMAAYGGTLDKANTTIKGVKANSSEVTLDESMNSNRDWSQSSFSVGGGAINLKTDQAKIGKSDLVASSTTDHVIPYVIPAKDVSLLNIDASDINVFTKVLAPYAKDLNETEVSNGDILLIDVYDDVAYKENDGDNHHHFYGAIIQVSDRTDNTLKSAQVKGKTVDVTTQVKTIDESSAISGEDLSTLIGHEVVLDYAQAAGAATTLFTVPAESYSEIVGVRIVPGLDTQSGQKVFNAWNKGTEWSIEETDEPLPLKGEGAQSVWMIVKVKAQNGDIAYNVMKINVSAKISDSAVILEGITNTFATNADGIKTAFTGNFAGGTRENPGELIAEIPDSTVQSGNEDLKNIGVTFTVKGAKIEWDFGTDSKAVSNYTNTQLVTDSNSSRVTVTSDFSGDRALYVRVTAEDGKTVNYYKLKVVRAADSADANIIKGKVVGNTLGNTYTELEVTADIEGLPGGTGTWRSPAKITATLPHVDKAWDAYEGSTKIEIVTEENAKVKYLAKEASTTLTANANINQDVTVSKWEENHTKTYTINNIDLSEQSWIYFLVEAEDGKTTKVYELHVTMAGAGTEARINDVIPMDGNVKLSSYAVSGLTTKPSKNPEKPTKVEVMLPYGTNADQLTAKLETSTGATVTYFDNADYDNGRTILGTLADGESCWIKVESENGTAEAYYELVIRIADLKVKASENNVELNLDKKLLIVKNGEVGAAELANKLEYAGTLEMYDIENENLIDVDKVGTGSRIEVGDTEITVIVLGDTNGDGLIVPSEASKVLDVYAGNATVSGYGAIAADANQDGSITPADASTILDIYAK